MNFVGNHKVRALLQKSLEKGILSHAYLFSGPRHVGKRTLAEYFAASLIEGLKKIELNREISNSTKMDILMLAPEKEEKKGIIKERNIKIEAIRDAQAALALFPYGGKHKVLIIDDAHKMGIGAQNALLKTLEEPNQTSVLILVTDEEAHILPTIKSRCQTVNFGLFDENELQEMIPANFIQKEALLLLSLGRPGLVRKFLADSDLFADRLLLMKKLRKLENFSINEKIGLANELSKDTMLAIEGLTLLLWLLRNKAWEQNADVKSAYEKIRKVEEAGNFLKRTNANAKLILENLFLNI